MVVAIPDSSGDSYVFPNFSVGVSGNARLPYFHGVDLTRPIGEWKKAWKIACNAAGLTYRWHDCHHTFITRLAENPKVSEETIRALARHVSKKMLERCSHIRISAKQAAIPSLEQAIPAVTEEATRGDRAQNWAESEVTGKPELPN